jgi:hypothetical protein
MMTRALVVGQKPETIDFSDPAPPGFNAEKIQAGIDIAEATMTDRGWGRRAVCPAP